MSDSQETTPPLDLSSLRLAPSWVADFGKSKPLPAPTSPRKTPANVVTSKTVDATEVVAA
ncbi:hypothetical protein [Verrucomicrobium spinosum]|uniref:hypothetical protein n=1 Tax=Verrucomicrobium spinosum TaxID=2736 RepID=UPI000946125F|nr:hypothetical protein [Verrucomicrobium spinosum]